MTAPFVARRPFRVHVSHGDWLNRLPVRFGAHDLEIGDPEFDATFVVRGNDPDQVERFLSAGVRRAIEAAMDDGQFEVKDEQLYFHEWGLIRDAERLVAVSNLFEVALAQLQEIGVASR